MSIILMTIKIQAPIDRIFDLARSIDLHASSMLGSQEKAIDGVTSGLIGLGQEVTWRAKHFGVWQRLTSRITAYQEPVHFQDSMVRGAFKRLVHDHYFLSIKDAVVMMDAFDYDPPLGLLGRLGDWLFLKSYMTQLLKERNQVIKTIAESTDWKQFLSPERKGVFYE
jgi:ligand-binding SRPBCC domain-containing protein